MVEADSVRNWVAISSAMIGVTLTILILIMTLFPSGFDNLGTKLIVYLLLISFVLFVNSVTTNSRVLYELARQSPEGFVNKWVKFAEFSFGLGFTLVIITFALTAYLIVDIIASTILMLVAWIVMFIYSFLNDPTDTSVFAALRSWKRNLWFIIELVGLIFLYLDAFGIIPWLSLSFGLPF
ncbi:MAG: hypothetical protein ACFFDI_15115 [Promethearchaeota archaeon]